MRFLFRWVFRLFLALVALVVALALLKDALLKSLTEHRIRSATGLDVRIGKFQAGLLDPTVTIEDFKLYNTAEFGGSPLLEMPELHVECDAAALTRRKLRFKLVRFHLREFNVVESADGRTNIVSLLGRLDKSASGREAKTTRAGLAFDGIDVLNMTLGAIKYTNLKHPRKNAEFHLGLKNEIVTGIRSMDDLSALLLKILLNRGITFIAASRDAATNSTATKPPELGHRLGKPGR